MRTGHFQREKAGIFRRFSPISVYEKLEDVPLEHLKERGKKLILLDVDNTLVEWKAENFSDEVLAWIKKARELDFALCILSNTRHPTRLKRISERLGIEFKRDKFKPSPVMYNLALQDCNLKPEEAVMIGDQILTDIWGANRAKIEGIWVHKIHSREFIGTRFNRRIEALIMLFLYRTLMAFEETVSEDPSGPPDIEDAQSVVSEFLKFGIVGGSSFAIDLAIFWALRYSAGGHFAESVGTAATNAAPFLFKFASTSVEASVPLFKIVSGTFAITNSFYWNRRWTFKIKDKEKQAAQFRRFFVISIIGLALNSLVVTLFLTKVFPQHTKPQVVLASVAAAFIVAVWNFSGQKLWAFRKK